MSSFTKDLIIRFIPEAKKFKVFIAFDYHVGSEDSEEVVSVPKDFLTDLASIPWFARWLIPKVGKHAQAAVLHDFIYYKGLFARDKCDLIFLEAMAVLKVPKWKRFIMYKAVNIFGWYGWNRRRKEEQE